MRTRKHPEFLAFLAAVGDVKTAQLTALVFADWLDEHGEPQAARGLRWAGENGVEIRKVRYHHERIETWLTIGCVGIPEHKGGDWLTHMRWLGGRWELNQRDNPAVEKWLRPLGVM